VSPVHKDRQLYVRGPPEIYELVQGASHRPAGKEHVVHENDLHAGYVEFYLGGVNDRLLGYFRPHRGRIALSVVLMALHSLVPGALVPKALYGWHRRDPEAGDRSQLPLFGAALFALALPLALLGVASQWPWYVMPGLPAAALLGGAALERLIYGRSSVWSRALLAAAALVPLLLRAVVLAPDPDYQPFLRPSFFWPLEASYYRFVSGAQDIGFDLLLVSVIGAVLGAAWVLELRRPGGRGSMRPRFAPFALALCLVASLLVLRDHWRWLSLPPAPCRPTTSGTGSPPSRPAGMRRRTGTTASSSGTRSQWSPVRVASSQGFPRCRQAAIPSANSSMITAAPACSVRLRIL